ncbi:EF-hand domain-containing protein [Nonomuraea sp. NPDC003804]|uniref:EF-hand domain-containing protein n=1 Tax=Nonomuraea sp. NPDC003804 TaxID=3154547 RepID=UPI0033ACB8FF
MSDLSPERLAELRQTFDAIDAGGDGFISQAELVRHFPGLPGEALGSLEQNADADGDGRISFEEFVRLVG